MSARTPLRPGDQLPEGWRWVRLGEIATVKSGGTPRRGNPSYWGGDIPWVKISDITTFYVSSTEETITEEGLTHSSAKLFPAGAILFTIFATIGKVAILDIEAATNQAIAGIFNISESLDTQYLAHYLQFAGPQMANRGRGMAQDNINLTMLRSLEVLLPPLETQRRIVAWLDEAFSHLQAIKERHAQAEREAAALLPVKLTEVFGRAEEEGWPWVKLSSVVQHKTGVWGPEAPSAAKGFPVVRSTEIDGFIIKPANAAVRLVNVKNVENYRLQSGDILINKSSGSPHLVGWPAIFLDPSGGRVYLFSNFMLRLRPVRSKVEPWYLLYYLHSPIARSAYLSAQATTSGLRNLRVRDFLNQLIPLPPLETQRRIVEEIEAFEKEVRKIRETQNKSRRLMAKLEESVLTEAFQPDRWI